MARPLREYEDVTSVPTDVEVRRKSDRSTARALAAAIAALAITTIVVTQSARAMDPRGTTSGNSFESGTVSLVDDDLGRSLVRLENMSPGRPVTQCISVTYAGTILPVELTLGAVATGDVAEYVDVRVEQGNAGGFDECDGFVPSASLYHGPVAALAEDESIVVGTIRNEGDAVSFRFTFDLADVAEAAGRAGSVDFVWEAVPV